MSLFGRGHGRDGQKLELPQHAANRAQRAAELAANAKHYQYERKNPLSASVPPWMARMPAPESRRPENYPALARLTGIAVRLWSYRLAATLRLALARRRKKHPFDRAAKDPYAFFHELYRGRFVPWAARGDTWKTDEAFGYQRLVGLTPAFLEAVVAIPPEFKVTDDDVRRAPAWPAGASIADMAAARRLWMIRHPQAAGVAAKPGAVVCSPHCLLLERDDGKLVPVAIQLFVDSDVVFTPADDLAPDGTRTNRWLVAKMFCTNVDALTHIFFSHCLLTHLLIEAWWGSACRNLSDRHPLKALLKPHTEGTHLIGHLFRPYYATPGGELVRLHQASFEGVWQLMRRRYAEWSFADLDVPSLHRKRGWDHPGALPGYFYRDDSRRHFDLLEAYLRRVCTALYPADGLIAGDFELQAWVRDLADPVAGCGLRGLPVDADGGISTRDQLVKLLVGPLFQAIVQHSHVDNSSYHFFGFAPNMPLSLYLAPPRDHAVRFTDEQIAAALPSPEDAALQFALPFSNFPFHPRPRARFFDTSIGRFADDFMEALPPEPRQAVRAAVAAWQRDLDAYADFQESRDRTLWTGPYDLLNPRNMSNSVWY